MADYRGGDRHTTVHGDALIKAIREGRTERQRQRNLTQKLLIAGVQGGLTLGRGVAGYVDHKQAESAAQDRDAAAYAKAPIPNYKSMAAAPTDARVPSWLTGGPVTNRTELGVDNEIADYAKPAQANPYDKDPMVTRAEDALLGKAEQAAAVTWGVDDEQRRRPGTGRGMMGSQ